MKKMGYEEEILAGFHREDIGKFHTGKIKNIVFPVSRSKAHRDGVPHVICRMYCINTEGQFLVQRRSYEKIAHPGLFTDSASGHVRYVDSFNYRHIEEEAKREMEEEMGTKILYLRLLDIHLEEFSTEGFELAYNFIGVVENNFCPDPTETHPDSGFKEKEELSVLLKTRPNDFVKVAHMYWSKILKENQQKKVLEEYEIKKNIRSPSKEKTSSGKQSDECSSGEKNRKKVDLELFQIQKIDKKEKEKYVEQINREKNQHKNKKESIIGAFIGRFQPFHNGHLNVIMNALNKIKMLKIGIGSAQYKRTEENPFSFDERKEMIVRSLNSLNVEPSNYEIFGVDDKHDMEKWADEVFKVLGDFDVFYSNSPWTRQIFLKRGIPVSDEMKFNFDVYNGTYIRKKMKSGESIQDLVPKPVVEYLDEINAPAVLKS